MPSTEGWCEAVAFGYIDEGHFNETRLDGLKWAMIVKWPGEIAEGNGRQQALIDERADASQREALRKILHGESTAPGATHFYVFNSTMSKVSKGQTHHSGVNRIQGRAYYESTLRDRSSSPHQFAKWI
jgi:hypothetical protein